MPSDKAILTEEQIAEIQAILDGDDFEAKYMAANVDNVAALCQTVRAAWATNQVLNKSLNEFCAANAEAVDQVRILSRFRTRAIALCRDKAAEWEALFKADVSSDHDDKIYYARAANELREALENLDHKGE